MLFYLCATFAILTICKMRGLKKLFEAAHLVFHGNLLALGSNGP